MAGRKPIEFSQKDRDEIEHLSGLCLSHDEIALLKKCNADTLKKHCQVELDRGRVKSLNKVVNALFKLIDKGEASAIYFYLKTRHGWKDKSQLEISGVDGSPLIAVIKDK
jgi:hypothetical protein